MSNQIEPPLISIGLPVFNGEPYICESIESILAQTFKNYELIICDNASTDRTQEICELFTKNNKNLTYYRHEKNKGAAFNYNYAFSLSKGKYFKWASADDLLDSFFLEACITEIIKNPNAVLCYPKTILIDENGKKIEDYLDLMDNRLERPSKRYKKFHQRLKKSDKCNAIFGLIKTSALKESRLIDSFVNSDTVLLAELVLLGQIIEVDRPLFFRRIHSQMSIEAYKPAERTVWFDTEKRSVKRAYVNWRTGMEFIRSIKKIKIPLYEKIPCFFTSLSWMLWRRKLLWSETFKWLYWKFMEIPEPIKKPIQRLWKFFHRQFRMLTIKLEGK